MTVEEMVDQALVYVYEDHLEPQEAAEKAFVEDDAAAVRTLAVIGLRHLVNYGLKDDRRRSADRTTEIDEGIDAPRSGRFQHRTHPTEGAAYFWLTKSYGTADGQTRALLDFAAEDWHHNLERETAHFDGAVRRLPLWSLGVELMESYPRVKTTAGLPKAAKNGLEAAAEAALRGGWMVV